MGVTESMSLSRPILTDLVDAARHAPSPDNNQPWGFGLEETGIRVYHNRKRALSSDVRDFFSWIGLGAAMENIALRASCHGLKTTVDYHSRPFPSGATGEEVAVISLERGGEVDPLSGAIENRVTNRRFYGRAPLPASECQALSDAVTAASCRIYWLTEKPQIRQFAQLAAATDRIRFEHRPFHEEFHSVLRYSASEAQQAGDGLELKSLELPITAGPLLRWLKPWSRMRFANRLGMSRAFANYSKTQILRSGAIGLLATSDCSDFGYLQAGRMFQRLWLKATLERWAFQPLGSLPLFLTKYEDQGPQAFLPVHAARLSPLRSALDDLFPDLAGTSPVMAFRVGRAKPPSARSYRFPLEVILPAPG